MDSKFSILLGIAISLFFLVLNLIVKSMTAIEESYDDEDSWLWGLFTFVLLDAITYWFFPYVLYKFFKL